MYLSLIFHFLFLATRNWLMEPELMIQAEEEARQERRSRRNGGAAPNGMQQMGGGVPINVQPLELKQKEMWWTSLFVSIFNKKTDFILASQERILSITFV